MMDGSLTNNEFHLLCELADAPRPQHLKHLLVGTSNLKRLSAPQSLELRGLARTFGQRWEITDAGRKLLSQPVGEVRREEVEHI